MADYTVKVVNLERVLGKLAPVLYLPAVVELIQSAALLAERTARSGAPRDTAALARSITSDVRPTAARVYSTLSYAGVMEEGRRPGARMPPPQSLLGWMARHGLAGVSPWVLARAIARRGVKGRFFMRSARDAVVNALPTLAQVAAKRVEQQWASR